MTGKQLGVLIIILQQACRRDLGDPSDRPLADPDAAFLHPLHRRPAAGAVHAAQRRLECVAYHPSKIQVLRAAVTIGYAFVLMYWFTTIPLADATAIGYTQAVYIVLFAGWILGEAAGLRRWLAVLVGLVGAVVLIKPSYTHTTAIYLAILLGTSLKHSLLC